MISETAHSSLTKLIGYDFHVGEQGIGYSNRTPDPQGIKIQVSPDRKTLLTKAVRHDYRMVKIASAPPEELARV